MLSLCLKNINNTTISSNNLSIEDVDCKNKIIPETKTVLKLAIAETLNRVGAIEQQEALDVIFEEVEDDEDTALMAEMGLA